MSENWRDAKKKYNPDLYVRLKTVAAVLLSRGYDSVKVVPSPHPTDDAVIFEVRVDENTSHMARIRTWRLEQMTDLQIIEEIMEQVKEKWKRV